MAEGRGTQSLWIFFFHENYMSILIPTYNLLFGCSSWCRAKVTVGFATDRGEVSGFYCSLISMSLELSFLF